MLAAVSGLSPVSIQILIFADDSASIVAAASTCNSRDSQAMRSDGDSLVWPPLPPARVPSGLFTAVSGAVERIESKPLRWIGATASVGD